MGWRPPAGAVVGEWKGEGGRGKRNGVQNAGGYVSLAPSVGPSKLQGFLPIHNVVYLTAIERSSEEQNLEDW